MDAEPYHWPITPKGCFRLRRKHLDDRKIGTVLYLAWPLRLTVCNAISEHLDGATPQGRQEPRLAAPFVSVMNYFCGERTRGTSFSLPNSQMRGHPSSECVVRVSSIAQTMWDQKPLAGCHRFSAVQHPINPPSSSCKLISYKSNELVVALHSPPLTSASWIHFQMFCEIEV